MNDLIEKTFGRDDAERIRDRFDLSGVLVEDNNLDRYYSRILKESRIKNKSRFSRLVTPFVLGGALIIFSVCLYEQLKPKDPVYNSPTTRPYLDSR